MSCEYCEGCDRTIDTDEDVEGVYVVTRRAKLYGDDPHPEEIEFSCSECQEKLQLEYESNESAAEDYFEAKRRGEL